MHLHSNNNNNHNKKKTFVFFVCKFQAFMLSLLVKHPLHSTAHNIWSQLQKYELFCSYLFLGIKITIVQKELGLHLEFKTVKTDLL